MDEKLKVIIAIPTYRRPDIVKRLIECLKVQADKDFVCVVLNDGKDAQTEKYFQNNNWEFELHYLYSKKRVELLAREIRYWILLKKINYITKRHLLCFWMMM